MNITFIGFGNMAQAIAESLHAQKNVQLRAASPSLPVGVNRQGIKTGFNNRSFIEDADIVLLAVKPDKIKEVLDEIATQLPVDCLLISVASGTSLERMASFCKPGQAIVRTMPNTPIAANAGATGLIANPFVNALQKKAVEMIFQTSGICAWLEKEDDINAITALSGSGPAYCFLFIEALVKAARQLGLEKELAEQFAQQTLAGSLALLKKTGDSPENLRKKVTSPAGTTHAAIAILQNQGFEELIFHAMQAACKRAQQMNH